MKTVAVIPCYNEEKTIGSVTLGAKEHVYSVIVADDASTDKTKYVAGLAGAVVVSKDRTNQGAGATTAHGIEVAKMTSPDIVVTLDGDGQHNPSEIPKIIESAADDKADLVIGSRFLLPIPVKVAKYRKFGIDVITWLYNAGHKQKITDGQSCFRAYSKKFLDTIKITEKGFSFSVETLIKARQEGLRIKEVPVSCIYHKERHLNSSINPVIHGLSVALAVIKWRLKIEFLSWMKYIAFVLFKAIARRLVGHGLGGIKPLARLYVILCSLLMPKDSQTVEINNCLIQIDRRKIDGITQRIFFEGSFEAQTTELFKRLIREGDRVIDVGANIGYFTLLSSKLVGEKGKVWALEPEPKNIEDLQRNIELNKFSNVEVVSKAASNKNGKATMYIADMESGAHSLVRKPLYCTKTMEIETIKLDDLLNGTNIDFMKSDAEGHDTSVLLGANNLIQSNQDIKLIVEFLLPGVESPEYTCEEFWQLLEEHFGFKYIYIIDEIQNFVKRGDLEFAKKCYSKYKLSVNLLCSRKEVSLANV